MRSGASPKRPNLVTMCKNPAITAAKAVSNKTNSLNKTNREDMIETIYGLCVFLKSSPGNKTHLILNNAVLIVHLLHLAIDTRL